MKPGMQWPIGIVVILASSVIANVALMRLANHDPSFAVEPDYYKRAVAFDTTMRETLLSNALMWTASVKVDAPEHGQGMLTVQLLDRSGTPVVVDSIRADAFFNARANDVTRVRLVSDSPNSGRYTAHIPITHAGQWEVRIDARRGADHFVSSERVEVPVERDTKGRDSIEAPKR